MFQSVRFRHEKEMVAIVCIVVFLTGFVGFLLVSNYHSLQKLQDSTLKQYKSEFDTRASKLANFLESQRQQVTSIASGGKLELYFENKALGMSMKYGLRATLLALDIELREFVRHHQIEGKRVYQRLVIYDTHGNWITGSGSASSNAMSDQFTSQSLLQLPEGFYAFQAGPEKNQYLFYTRPYHFKNDFAAQIVGFFSVDMIRSQFLRPGWAAIFSGLFAPSSQFSGIRQRNIDAFSPPSKHMLLPEGCYQHLLSKLKKSQSVLPFQTSVGKTNLQLKEIASAKMITGSTSPRTLLLALLLLFMGLLGAAVVVMRMVAHNLVLQTRFEESSKREKDIASKNLQLEAEIEDRKRAEAERVKLEAQLQRGQKMEAIGMLAGGVAHDLNNILTGIVSYPDLLLMQLPEESSLRKPIMTIKKSGEKATAIVQDLLTMARRGVVVNEVANLNTVVGEYLQSPEHEKILSFHESVRVKAKLEKNVLNIMGSPIHLSKVIMNLISNAAEAMPKGGEISISTKKVYINRPIGNYEKVNEGEYALLSVSDTGSGMSPEDSEKIFEPFFTKKQMGRSGTGLGMSVVWGTVKDHNGYIDVQTVLGRGTTFHLYFPVTREKAKPAQPESSIKDYNGHGERILVADDVKEQRDIAKMIFSELGYSVATVENGEKAVEYVEKNDVDLVVLDMIMDPGIDGLETYERILRRQPGQKAIITSGFSEAGRIRKARQLGVRHYIKKPYTLEEIAMSVKAELTSN